MLNQSITSNNAKNRFKIQNQPETQNVFELRYVFLGAFKV
jgi:hypothetical protein